MAPTAIQRFITEVDEDLEEIENQISQVNHVTDWSMQNEDDDPRVTDLPAAECRDYSSMATFRRGLSQRSLAIQFNKWELVTYEMSEIGRRASYLLKEPARKLEHVAKFIKKHGFKKRSTIRLGIQHGMKLLICEKLLNGTGISAILIFRYIQFRLIKLSDLSGLENAIKNAIKIKELVSLNADWIDRCQKCYDGK